MRILIVKMSSMGDVVHAQPLAVDLRAALPQARITWVVEQPFAPICRLNPAIDEVVPIAWRRWRKQLFNAATRADMLAFHQHLTDEAFDLVLDCQGLIKSALVSRMAPATRRSGPAWAFAREPLASLAYDQRVVVPRDWHVVRRNRAIGAAACGYAIESAPRFGLTTPPLALADAPWRPPGRHALLVSGASRMEKLWPDVHWITTAVRLQQAGLALIWFWGNPAERARAEDLARRAAEAAGAAATPFAIPPFLDVGRSAQVIAAADIVVGLDTGFTHLAGALGRPTIGIFCDFDAVQCAVTGDAFCASFGGVGVVPDPAEVIDAVEQALRL